MTKKLLNSLKGEIQEIPPIWLMRQAGRYLPEYRKIRQEEQDFLSLCYNPKLSSEITLQPIRRFDFDGAIIFSDILVIPDALGVKTGFVKGDGPKLEAIDGDFDLNKLKIQNILPHLEPVFENIDLTKSKLPNHTTLLGFSGAVWTLATYMVEGGSSKNFEKTRSLALKNPQFFQKLSDILVESISIYLNQQIEAGVDAIQIFDSWAGALTPIEFQKWAIEPTKKIVENVKKQHPNTPIIGFPRGCGPLYTKYAQETGINAISCDCHLEPQWIKQNIPNNITVQGNLDNIILANDINLIESEVKNILDNLKNRPFIFNLGHGILPNTPIKNVERLIELVRCG